MKKKVKKKKYGNWRMRLFSSPIFQDKKEKKRKEKEKRHLQNKLNILFSERFCVKFVVEGPKYKYTTIYCVIRGYLEPTKCISRN